MHQIAQIVQIGIEHPESVLTLAIGLVASFDKTNAVLGKLPQGIDDGI